MPENQRDEAQSYQTQTNGHTNPNKWAQLSTILRELIETLHFFESK
jgi:hypothetical protein